MAQAAATGDSMASLPPAPAAGRRARHLHAVARTAVGPASAPPPETGDAPPDNAIDPAVLTARAEAGQPAGHKSQLGMRLPPPDWPPDSNGYRLYKQFN